MLEFDSRSYLPIVRRGWQRNPS